MKIDLHCHTRKIKKGDAATREVTCEKFIEQLLAANVSIVAITNHNCFDYAQYIRFNEQALKNNIQIWPGIELDVKGDDSKGHCIIIANPKYVSEFSKKCDKVIGNVNPDAYEIGIHDLISEFQEFDITVIAHYAWKNPSLSETDLDVLRNDLSNEKPLFLEVTQLRSAGILYAHNINSFIGSDVQDWNNYSNCSLPELKMPISDYEHFNLLVKKDEQVLKTFVDQKINEVVSIAPFDDCSISLPIYNDINVIFGGKGTGKSSFLDRLKYYFYSKGNADVSYYDGQTKDTEFKKLIRVENDDSDFYKISNDDCKTEFEDISNWTDVSITSIDKYKNWAQTKDIKGLSKKFGFKDATFMEIKSDKEYKDSLGDYEKLLGIGEDLENLVYPGEYLAKDDFSTFNELYSRMVANSKSYTLKKWIEMKSLDLENFTINTMKKLCKTKSGINQLPTSTGLLDTFSNCLSLYNKTLKIKEILDSETKIEKIKIGDLESKGSIYNEKQIFINPINAKNVSLKKGASYGINDLRDVYNRLTTIIKIAFQQEKGQEIAGLNTTIKSKGICSLRDFIGVKSRIVNRYDEEYIPSNGEQSMLLLANALVDEKKNVFILDEPELSVGHKYINEVIVPRLIELSKLNKIIIISTHDANIGVRTLPLLSVYREYTLDGKYNTYIGNPFTDKLIDCTNNTNSYLWSRKCMETLEGGEEAFIERGEIYGK